MGVVCCPLSPEIRAINKKNYELEQIIKLHLQDLDHYQFSNAIVQAIREMPTRYMYNQGILEDIEKLYSLSHVSGLYKNQASTQFYHDDLKDSCLILEDEDIANKQGVLGSEEAVDSFAVNIKKNQSMVVQINILYKQEINLEEYSSSLHLFLKWANMFQQHTFGGFLKPLYRKFYHHLETIPISEYSSITDEICIFVQFMVAVVTDIYGLKHLAAQDRGKLVKNENVYNLIMTFLFKKTKIKPFLLQSLRERNEQKITQITQKMKVLSKKPIEFFGVSSTFCLQRNIKDQASSEISKSTDTNLSFQPYLESLKLVRQVSKSSSPITKLKTIIAISKQICRDINNFYSGKSREAPELDPDNLSSIVMYLLIKNGDPKIYQELLIVESFTTTNCLSCISGYYLNVFMAAIESILTLRMDQ